MAGAVSGRRPGQPAFNLGKLSLQQLAVAHIFRTDLGQLAKPVRAGARKAMAKYQALSMTELRMDKGWGGMSCP